MRGIACPACSGPLVTFDSFLCEVDVDTVLRCPSCGATLRRSRAVFVLLGAFGLIFGIAGYLVVRLTLADPTGGGLMALALFFVAAPPALFVLIKFIGWKYVPWVVVADTTPRSPTARA